MVTSTRPGPCLGVLRRPARIAAVTTLRLDVLGIKIAASTVWEILQQAGIDPAPERTSSTWASFLRSQAGALLACDFFETVTLPLSLYRWALTIPARLQALGVHDSFVGDDLALGC
jgi:hypothetical protein